MKPLTEQEIRAIVQDEMRKNYNSGNPQTPPHNHDGTDGFFINPIDLIGWTPMPVSPTKYLNQSTGLNEYGFASPQQMAGGDSSGAGHPSQYALRTDIGQYPIPIIVGNGAGVQSAFEGGYAPEGTLVYFAGTAQNGLYIRFDGRWEGVGFPLTA